jgi:hypothetical protein
MRETGVNTECQSYQYVWYIIYLISIYASLPMAVGTGRDVNVSSFSGNYKKSSHLTSVILYIHIVLKFIQAEH